MAKGSDRSSGSSKGPRGTRGNRSGSAGSAGRRSGGGKGKSGARAGGKGHSSSDGRRGSSGTSDKRSGGKDGSGAGRRTSSPSRADRAQLRTSGTGGGDLPNWIKEEVARVTARDKRDTVLALLGEAADAFADGRFPRARQQLLRAKKLTSRVATIRELLGLTAYRMGNWDEALRELRTYRRIDGDTTHMSVEMDCQRALDRPEDVEKTWERFRELGGRPAADAEMRVVYASFLLDRGEPRRAWSVINPGRIATDPREWDLRRWYVASRVAAALGDVDTAQQLAAAIERNDLAFPGLDQLHEEIEAAGA